MKPASVEQSIFAEALARPIRADRTAYLDAACGTDATLRARIEALLQSAEFAGDFLEKPPTGFLAGDGSMISAAFLSERPGDRIGRYKLLQQIGEGGCGVVYMAEQEEPVRRRVAVKVIKLGMDTKSVVARFEAERQALAMMNHPNIAKVFDAGTTDQGRPYFVMELVRGMKITDYCDENQLSTRERLKLFSQVCGAIQHAHQKGIIHRDIKPSNILVTVSEPGAPGCPKVIDFGIAKATTGQRLTDKTVFTAFEQFIGTPAYMSPEQAMMTSLDIDTRTDIYALGVLLYELLTGQTPFDGKDLMNAGLDAMRRIIREQEPARPSTRLSTLQAADLTTVANHRHAEPGKLGTLLRGDLDWIVMKCLEKDRARRYETANGLALDIQRHLGNEAVTARPPSFGYRLQKLVRRHKLTVAAAVAVATALLLGVVVSTWQASRATRAEGGQSRLRQQAEANEKRAEAEAAKSRQVSKFLKEMLKGVGPAAALGRDTTMLREIVDKTAARLGTDLKGQPEAEIELRFALAQAYFDMQLYKPMEQTARETLRLARATFGQENLAVADALGQVGRALMFLRVIDESEKFTREAIAMQRRLRGEGSLEEASSLANLSDVLRHQWILSTSADKKNKLMEAEAAIRAAVAIYRKHGGGDSAEFAWRLHTLSLVLHNEGRFAEAEPIIRESLELSLETAGEDHPFTAAHYHFLGVVLRDLPERSEEAEAAVRKALAIQVKTEGTGGMAQVHTHTSFAFLLEKSGKLAEAETHFRKALEMVRPAMGPDFPDLPQYVANLAAILRKNGKAAEADALIRPLSASQAEKAGEPSSVTPK